VIPEHKPAPHGFSRAEIRFFKRMNPRQSMMGDYRHVFNSTVLVLFTGFLVFLSSLI